MPGILAIIISLLMGLVVGWVNGFLTVTVGLPSFVTTLGTGFVLQGIMLITSHAEQAAIPGVVQGIGHWIGTYAWSEFTWAVVLAIIFHWCCGAPGGGCTPSRWAATSSARRRRASTWPGSSTATS